MMMDERLGQILDKAPKGGISVCAEVDVPAAMFAIIVPDLFTKYDLSQTPYLTTFR